ncbi:MAG TPA: hypothetical protein VMW89_10155 [Desulfatiglandales bacterium]|nr:hypothetical protein [Desulfatiglandales bacterium]
MSTYKVSFIIEGSRLDEDTDLTKANLEEFIKNNLDRETMGLYSTNRGIDTEISNLVIEQNSG